MTIGFAHRGGRHTGTRPNTLAAFAKALGEGASGLETDAWVTADGVAVLDHDGVVGWRRRPIASLARAELPRHLPGVDELYAELGGDFELSVDVKDPRAAPAVIAAVERGGGRVDRLWLCHSESAVLAGWAAHDARVRLVRSTTRRALAPPFGPAHSTAAAVTGSVHALNLRAREWTAELIDAAHTAGTLAFAWGANDPPILERLLAAGVDGVYCDDVAAMATALRPP